MTRWTLAHQAPLSMEFPRQEYWSGLLFPPPENLPNPGIEPVSLVFSCIGRRVLYHCTTWEAHGSVGIETIGTGTNIQINPLGLELCFSLFAVYSVSQSGSLYPHSWLALQSRHIFNDLESTVKMSFFHTLLE